MCLNVGPALPELSMPFQRRVGHARRVETLCGLRHASVEQVGVTLQCDERVGLPSDGLDELHVSAAATRRETQVWRRSWKR